MKKIVLVLSFVMFGLLFSSCTKEQKPQVKIKNWSGLTIYDIKVGSTSFGQVGNMVTSAYKDVEEGANSIYVKLTSTGYLSYFDTTPALQNDKTYTIYFSASDTTITQD
ncbi:MAG TPA: hypothetical protein DHW82_10380 [Spirochaetia bacterium]|nr:hypothetical protein [Spirochaetia bacterium]